MTSFKEGATRAGGTGRHHVRRALVTAEIALAVTLVIGAALLVRTVYNLTKVDPGFDPSRRVTFGVALPQPNDTRRALFRRLLDDLEAVPGIHAAAAMSGLPPDRAANFNNTGVENYTSPEGDPFVVVDYDQYVIGNYFDTMGIPIVAGRGFDRRDTGAARSVVINEALAHKTWQDGNPIGRRIRRDYWSKEWFTVVGVASDVKQGGVDRPAGTEMYFVVEEDAVAPPRTMNVVVQTTLAPSTLAETIDRVVHAIDPSVPIVRLRDMDAVFTESIRRPRLLAQLLGGFAGLALLLAVIGTYGVLSYIVAVRRRELGIRIAVGATRSRVIALVMRNGATLIAGGVAIGLVGALAVNRLVASLLFAVEPNDPSTLIVVPLTIALVAASACWLPAWRASQVDPNVVLRAE